MCLYLYSFQNPNMGLFGRIICTILLNFFYVKYTYMPMALGLMALICGAQTREGNDSAVHTLLLWRENNVAKNIKSIACFFSLKTRREGQRGYSSLNSVYGRDWTVALSDKILLLLLLFFERKQNYILLLKKYLHSLAFVMSY